MQRDPKRAGNLYLEAAKQGNSYAETKLAWIYEHGVGLRRDLAEAIKWNRLAAEHGEASALNNLGYMYEHGIGTHRNLSKATLFYCRAARSKVPEATHNWIVIQESVQGIREDCELAAKWVTAEALRSLPSDASIEAGGDPELTEGSKPSAVPCAKR